MHVKFEQVVFCYEKAKLLRVQSLLGGISRGLEVKA